MGSFVHFYFLLISPMGRKAIYIINASHLSNPKGDSTYSADLNYDFPNLRIISDTMCGIPLLD